MHVPQPQAAHRQAPELCRCPVLHAYKVRAAVCSSDASQPWLCSPRVALTSPGQQAATPACTIVAKSSNISYQTSITQEPAPDFACIPGVDSPQAFQAYWTRVCRPRLEALYRTASGMLPRPALLPVVDQLIAELKQVSAPAHHCAQRHVDPGWRKAGADVAASCDKYEQYVYRSKGLYGKICEVERRLTDALSSKSEIGSSSSTSSLDSSSISPSTSSSQATSTTSSDTWVCGLTDAHGRHATAAQLARLAQLLRQSFECRGVSVKDGLSHLVVSHSLATTDQAWEGVREMAGLERRLASRVRQAVADVSISPWLELISVSWPETAYQSAQDNALTSSAEGVVRGEDVGIPWQHDALLQALVNRTPRATLDASDSDLGQPEELSRGQDSSNALAGTDGVCEGGQGGEQGAGAAQPAARWTDGVLLDRSATQQLLRLHPVQAVRQAVAEEGLLGRLSVMLRLLDKQAAVRSRIAQLYRAPSYAALMQSEGQCAIGSSGNVLSVLKRIAEATDGPARQQVHHMSSIHLPGSPRATQAPTSDQPQQGTPMQAAGTHSLAVEDVAYVQEQLRLARGCHVTYEEVQHNMSLVGIIQGLNSVLRGMDLQLRVMYAPPRWSSFESSRAAGTGGSSQASAGQAQLCDPDNQVVLHLYDSQSTQGGGLQATQGGGVQAAQHSDPQPASRSPPPQSQQREQRRLIGVVYLDLGGAYGTRQLRFVNTWGKPTARAHTDGGQADAEDNASASGNVPVVSVGLQWPWSGGQAGSLAAPWELMHELGHVLHLLLSSDGKLFKHFGGLHLPLDLLEVPSMLLEHLLMHPVTAQAIFRAQDADAEPMCMSVATRLASQYRSRHYSALDFQDQVMMALTDQLLNMSSADQELDALQCYSTVLDTFSAVPHVSGTLKRLSVLPVVSHHRAAYWAYCVCFILASKVWAQTLARDPFDNAAAIRLRSLCLAAGADHEPGALLRIYAGEGHDVLDCFSRVDGLWTGEAAV